MTTPYQAARDHHAKVMAAVLNAADGLLTEATGAATLGSAETAQALATVAVARLRQAEVLAYMASLDQYASAPQGDEPR